MKPEFTTKWECPICFDLCETESGAESHCEVPSPEERLVCPVCDESFSADTRYERKEADEHLKMHRVNKDGLLPEEVAVETYLDKLRFGKPSLGEWAELMQVETEFLIPND